MKQQRKEKNLKVIQFNLPKDIVQWIDESVKDTQESKSAFVARMLDTIRITQKKLSEV
jgi:metal-responsive CopG/Arc/MetJ family transcriptional regulator